jgi:hypothetical protein
MGMFQYDFNDLANFFRDIKFLNKYGGGEGEATEASYDFIRSLLLAAPSNPKSSLLVIIIFVIMNVFLYALCLCSIYLVYYLIFKGYPKFLPDILTLHMKNVVDVEKLLSRNNFLIDSYNILLDKSPDCVSGYEIYNKIYERTNLKDYITAVDNYIQSYYSEYKYNVKYEKAFKEYFYLYYKIYLDGETRDTTKTDPDSLKRIVDPDDGAQDATKPITVNGKEIAIEHHQYYNALVNYLVKNREYDTSQTTGSGKQSSDTKISNVFLKDKFKKYNQHKDIKIAILYFKSELNRITKKINNHQQNVLPYIVLPSSLDDIQKVKKDFGMFQLKIQNNNIYLPRSDTAYVPFQTMNEYSWYIAEILFYDKNGNQYSKLIKNIESLEPSPKMSAYMNLSVTNRVKALNKFNLSNNANAVEYINKLPILSHIYYNSEIIDKNGFYSKVMETYKAIINANCSLTGSTEIENKLMKLDIVGGNFKKIVNAVNICDLYFNSYSHEITKLLETKYMDDVQFLKSLWMPFVKDMIINRIFVGFVKYVKDSWIGDPFPTKNYLDFSVKYKFVEKTMSDVVANTWKRLFTSQDVGKPKPPETSF